MLDKRAVAFLLLLGQEFDKCTRQGFPRGIEKVLNFKISFQDLERIPKLAKICIKY